MTKKLDDFCDIIWLAILGVVGAIVAVLLIVNWNTWLPGAKAGAFLAIIMPLHVLEEWKLPGGLHYIYNIIFGSKEFGSKYLDRYPMSRFTDMITNIGLAWIPLIYAVLAQNHGLSISKSQGMLHECLQSVAKEFEGPLFKATKTVMPLFVRRK